MFKHLVYNLFGHTDYKHLLLAGDGLEMEKQNARVLKTQLNAEEVGDVVETKEIKGKTYTGTVVKLSKKYIRLSLQTSEKLWNLPYCYIKKLHKTNKRPLNIKNPNLTSAEIKNKLIINDIVKVKVPGKIQNGIIVNIGKSRATVKFCKQKR